MGPKKVPLREDRPGTTLHKLERHSQSQNVLLQTGHLRVQVVGATGASGEQDPEGSWPHSQGIPTSMSHTRGGWLYSNLIPFHLHIG